MSEHVRGPMNIDNSRRPKSHLWFLLLPILTAGMGSVALPLWTAARVGTARAPLARHEAPVPDRRTLLSLAAFLGVVTAIAAALFGTAPVDDTGAATGWQASVGALLALGLVGVGVALALKWRDALFPAVVDPRIAALNAQMAPEPVARARARRALRQQYRELAASDPELAREIGVGRPDVGDLDNGGLIDVNHVSAEVLVERLRVSNDEAARIIEGRAERGGYLSVDELVVFAAITPGATESAREYAVFLPR